MIQLSKADVATVVELVNSGHIMDACQHVQKVHGCTLEDAIVAVDEAAQHDEECIVSRPYRTFNDGAIPGREVDRTPPNDGEYDEAFEGGRR